MAKQITVHHTQAPWIPRRDREGFCTYDDEGAEQIAATLAARGGRMDQRILAGEEFGEHNKNTRYVGVHRGLRRCGELD
jgi:hypothetical protein